MPRNSVRIPKGINESIGDVIYLDESGIADLNDKQTRYFILTGVITENDSFRKYNTYYCQLKYKYLGNDVEIHSHDLFYNPGKYKTKFINELAIFIDNIPFGFFTVAVNKNNLINSTAKRKIKNPLETTFNKALSIYLERGMKRRDFFQEPISSILRTTSQYKIEDINRYFALEITYKEILRQYINTYTKEINTDIKEFEIIFEDSPNKTKILELTEKVKNLKEPFSLSLSSHLSNISFPNKRAKYLGLELADIISFGFNLSLYNKVEKRSCYRKIWEALNRRRIEFKNKKGIDMFIKL